MPRLAVLLLAVGACGPDVHLHTKPDDPVQVFPEITVEPTVLDFGELSSLDHVVKQVTITNEGLSTLEVDQLRFDGAASFELLADPLPWDLAPSEARTFEVGFQPTDAGEVQGLVTVVSNDDDEPEVRVDLAGLGALADLEITPDPMALGSAFVPCDGADAFWLTNRGTEPLRVDRIALEGAVTGGLTITPPEVPLTLLQNQPVAVPVAFDRADAVTLEAELVVESTDPAGPRRVPITGSARFAQSITETWDVPESLPVNIVFAVDQSCSMSEEQTALTGQFSTFRSILEAAGTDWKIGVVTGTSDFCFSGGVITPQTPNWGTAFSNAVKGIYDWPWTEKLLAATAGALWDGGRGGPPACNAAFTSPLGTPLHIVVLSDERNQSPLAWGDYLQDFRSFAGIASPLVVHAIVDFDAYPTGGHDCGGEPDDGPGDYDDIAHATGGYVLDICGSSWAGAVGSIAQQAVADLDLYKLKDRNVARGNVTVEPSSLHVSYDGVEVFPPAWTWSPGDIGIRFSPIPPAGTEVTITYGIQATCP